MPCFPLQGQRRYKHAPRYDILHHVLTTPHTHCKSHQQMPGLTRSVGNPEIFPRSVKVRYQTRREFPVNPSTLSGTAGHRDKAHLINHVGLKSHYLAEMAPLLYSPFHTPAITSSKPTPSLSLAPPHLAFSFFVFQSLSNRPLISQCPSLFSTCATSSYASSKKSLFQMVSPQVKTIIIIFLDNKTAPA